MPKREGWTMFDQDNLYNKAIDIIYNIGIELGYTNGEWEYKDHIDPDADELLSLPDKIQELADRYSYGEILDDELKSLYRDFLTNYMREYIK